MKRGFIRALWGIPNLTARGYQRRTKIINDVEMVQTCKFDKTDMVYVFGEDNYKWLVDLGYPCRLIDKKPIVWSIEKEHFRHKLEAFLQGAQDFDEYIFLDWDCIATKPQPADLWESFYKKQAIQASLSMYKKAKATWRQGDQRKVPCASFVYFRDKEIPAKLIQHWETLSYKCQEEVAMAKYMDEVMGGWKGMPEYWKMFEPDYFTSPLQKGAMFGDLLNTKNICFIHYSARTVGYFVGGAKSGNKQTWQK